jgi:hypothetical protein
VQATWSAVSFLLTYPDGIADPALRSSVYVGLCAGWFPIGAFLLVRAWRDA